MKILGIDPGTRITGYGIIDDESLKVIDYGCISIPQKFDIPAKYQVIYQSINALVTRHEPAIMVLESQYINKNPWAMMKLVGAKSIAQLVSAMHEIPVFEYAPATLKKTIVGNGRASKEQVLRMVSMQLGLSVQPDSYDAADALALAFCHYQQLKRKEKFTV